MEVTFGVRQVEGVGKLKLGLLVFIRSEGIEPQLLFCGVLGPNLLALITDGRFKLLPKSPPASIPSVLNPMHRIHVGFIFMHFDEFIEGLGP